MDAQTPLNHSPLGAEDAASRERGDLHRVFIDVRDFIRQPYQIGDSLNQIRVVVGKKGSGKTHILRFIEDELHSSDQEVIFTSLSDNTIPSNLEHQFQQQTDRPHARANWSRLWRICISLSILSNFIAVRSAPRVKKAVERYLSGRGLPFDGSGWPAMRSQLAAHFSSLFSAGIDLRIENIRQKSDPGTVLQRLLSPISSIERLIQFLDNTDLGGLETEVASLAKLYKPFHIIIDGVDEVAWRQPRMWLDFQVGLFDAVFFFHDAQRNTGDIAITIAIRNYVFVSARATPHSDRIRNLLSLNWDPNSARSFLNRRLRQVADLNFVDAEKLSGARPLAAWLGFNSVYAVRRKREEEVESYFLRHTRLSPRNLIRLFNLLCQEKNRLHLMQEEFGERDFRRVVEMVAEEVADLMLRTASEELIAFIDDISKAVPAVRNEGVVNWVSTELEDSIRELGKEVFDSDEYKEFLNSFLDKILPNIEYSDEKIKQHVRTCEEILWRSNVIAFLPSKSIDVGWVFSWSVHDRNPGKPARIGFHSSLIVRCGLEIDEHGPVF